MATLEGRETSTPEPDDPKYAGWFLRPAPCIFCGVEAVHRRDNQGPEELDAQCCHGIGSDGELKTYLFHEEECTASLGVELWQCGCTGRPPYAMSVGPICVACRRPRLHAVEYQVGGLRCPYCEDLLMEICDRGQPCPPLDWHGSLMVRAPGLYELLRCQICGWHGHLDWRTGRVEESDPLRPDTCEPLPRLEAFPLVNRAAPLMQAIFHEADWDDAGAPVTQCRFFRVLGREIYERDDWLREEGDPPMRECCVDGIPIAHQTDDGPWLVGGRWKMACLRITRLPNFSSEPAR